MKQQPNFKNVYVHDEGDKKVFCYRTGLCVYEEVLHRGIDPSRSYEVTFDNCGASVEMSGAEMMQRGLRVALSGSLSSELIIYEVI